MSSGVTDQSEHQFDQHEFEKQGSTAYLWYVVAIITLASALSFIDRQILNLMIGPVKRDLGGLTDTQISLIMGLAFAFIYNLVTYPMARIADAFSRRNLMIFGIAFWSVMTAMCGISSTYGQLFLARMGVGVGEATLSPAAYSMLADYFPPDKLPMALGLMASAPFIGQGLANIIGGPLIDYLGPDTDYIVPLLGSIHSWQLIFLMVGLPGVLVAVVFATVREPRRQGKTLQLAEGMADGKKPPRQVPFREVWAFVWERRKYFALHFLAYLGLSTQGFALFAWIVEFFVRKHGWTKTDIGLINGSIGISVGLAGSIFAGWMAGRMIRQGRPDSSLRLVMWGSICLGPLAAIMTVVDDPWIAIALFVPVTFFMAMPSGLSAVAIMSIAPNQLRGQMIAFYLIAVNFLAYTFAPTLPALLTDYVFRDEAALGYSLSILAVINYSMAAICLAFCLRYFREALEKAKAWA